MKIIIEGTAEELRNAIGSFGIPNEVVFDDGEKFVPFACGDLAGKNHRVSKDNAIAKAQITSRRTFKHLKEAIRNGEIDLSYKPTEKPEPLSSEVT